DIGRPLGENGCEVSHFHLAMKRTPSDSASGLCYYVDPSPFLDRMQPMPQWHQECKEFTFKHIGQVVDFFHFTDGFKQLMQTLKRAVVNVGRTLLTKAIDALPDTRVMGAMKGIAHEIIDHVDVSDPANLKNLIVDAP
ncbi:hypothetical protein BaRGS_00028711, partial [Batillaria attramentaria]